MENQIPEKTSDEHKNTNIDGDVSKSIIISGNGNVVTVAGDGKSTKKSPKSPGKSKRSRKVDKAIIIAVIGSITTIIAALIGILPKIPVRTSTITTGNPASTTMQTLTATSVDGTPTDVFFLPIPAPVQIELIDQLYNSCRPDGLGTFNSPDAQPIAISRGCTLANDGPDSVMISWTIPPVGGFSGCVANLSESLPAKNLSEMSSIILAMFSQYDGQQIIIKIKDGDGDEAEVPIATKQSNKWESYSVFLEKFSMTNSLVDLNALEFFTISFEYDPSAEEGEERGSACFGNIGFLP